MMRATRLPLWHQETAGVSVAGRFRPLGLPAEPHILDVVALCVLCARRASPLRPEGMSVFSSRTCGRRSGLSVGDHAVR